MKKYENISFLKTVMMLIIVLYHSMLFFGGEWFTYVEPVYNGNNLYYIAQWMNTFHIQTFTMASGFLFYYLKKEKKKYNKPKEDIKKRVKRLLIPYIFVSLLWAIPIGYYFFKYSIKEIINKYLLMVAPSQLWFLIMIFMVFLFFEIFGDKIKISLKNLIIMYITTTIIGFSLSYLNIEYFQIAKSVRYILYFYLGEYIYTNKDKLNAKKTLIMILASMILYVGLLYANSLNIKILHYGTKMIEPIVSILEVSTIYYICTILVENKIIKTNKIYKILEDNSFGIYLFHQQIIYFMIILLNGVVHPIIQALLSFAISLSISLLMSMLLKKSKVLKFIFGL